MGVSVAMDESHRLLVRLSREIDAHLVKGWRLGGSRAIGYTLSLLVYHASAAPKTFLGLVS